MEAKPFHSIFIPSPVQNAKNRALLYYIPGNPGLIDYYAPFLSYLRGLVNNTESHTAYDIYGRNLLGFADNEHEPFGKGREPWDLEGQIVGIGEDIALQRRRDNGEAYDKVILLGHSVGGYIAVEIISRHQKNPSKATHLNLEAGFLLFPTLTSIALSPSGKRATLLLQMPYLASHGHLLAKILLSLLSISVLRYIVQRVTGFGPLAVEPTVQWLSSKDGVWQAMHLGKSELRGICEETWDEQLWVGDVGPRFFVFYGNNDHWVDNSVREAFIKKRAAGKQHRVKVEIDEGKIPHAFCTHDESSFEIAKKVHSWIEEMDSKSV